MYPSSTIAVCNQPISSSSHLTSTQQLAQQFCCYCSLELDLGTDVPRIYNKASLRAKICMSYVILWSLETHAQGTSDSKTKDVFPVCEESCLYWHWFSILYLYPTIPPPPNQYCNYLSKLGGRLEELKPA